MSNLKRYNRRRRLRRLKTNVLYYPYALIFRAIYGSDFKNIVAKKVALRNPK